MERRDHRDGTGLPRWPAAVVLLAIGALYAVLSDGLTLGPRAFLLGLVAVSLVPLITAHLRGRTTASPGGSASGQSVSSPSPSW